MPSSSRHHTAALLGFARHVWSIARCRGVSSVVLSIAVGMVEGVGLLFLVPLLELVGISLGEGRADALAGRIASAFAWLGLPLSLPVVLGAFVAISAAQALLWMWQSLLNLQLEARVATRLRGDLYEAIVRADWLFLVRQRASDLAHVLTTEVDRVGGLVQQSRSILAGTAQITIALVIAALIAPAMTLVVAGAGLLLVVISRRRARRARTLGENYSAENGRLYGVLTDGLAALRTTKSLGAEERSVGTLMASQARFVDIWQRAVANQVRGKFWLDTWSVVVLALLVFGAIRVVGLAPGPLLLLLFIFARTMPRMSAWLHGVHLLLHSLPAYERVEELRQACRRSEEPRTDGPRLSLRSGITLDRVSFSYEPGRRALDAVSLRIPARRITALVGGSGAGKTTLADLVLGLLTPQEGAIAIDGEPLTRDTVLAWRRQVAYVSQDPFLFHDTIAANLRWAQPDASPADIENALERAGAAEFVARLPDGLETVVGDRGGRLSGGERQRLAIARALLRKPDLLILDEPTSALDAANEQHILETVAQLSRTTTVLLITHRLGAVRGADVIHVLESGRLIESGRWDELIAGPTRFRELSALQSVSS